MDQQDSRLEWIRKTLFVFALVSVLMDPDVLSCPVVVSFEVVTPMNTSGKVMSACPPNVPCARILHKNRG